ncbi:kelch-like protein 2 [Paramacrobiotus metropolitanus]|uniref:kelch-like protein 2 n=1 Tax=Paramacrobiotus metropolitanus TaxID=2943436 RepID=UPI002445B413|nr:kelch-like protein 2 [Paramacrobiotus metropolitanus]
MSKPQSRPEQPHHECLAVEFLRELRDLQLTGSLCDVVLLGSEESAVGIPCHRNVLTAHSLYFRAAFCQDWKDSSQPEYHLQNIDSRTLNELIQYAYTLDLDLSDDNVGPIVIAAQFLQMTRVVRLCWEYVEQRLCLSNCLAVHALASQCHNDRLANAALELILPHFVRVAQSQEFLQMDAQQLTALIASDEVEVFSEDQVWQAVVRWLDHDHDPGRLAHLPSVLQNVRVPFLSEQYRYDYLSVMDANGVPAGEAQSTVKRHSCGAQEVILCVGGCDDYRDVGTTFVFSPSVPAVWPLKDLDIPPGGCSAACLDTTSILISHFKGMKTVRRGSHYLDLFDEWRELAPMQTPRTDTTLAVLNGRTYAVGGCALNQGPMDFSSLTSVEVFDPQSDTWSAVAPLPVELAGFALVACDGRLFVFGGESAEVYNPVFSYDPKADAWTRLLDMPADIDGCVACVGAGGLIFVFGGCSITNVNRFVRVDAYNPASGQWIRKADLIRSRSSPGCAYLDGKLYVIGGDVEEWDSYGTIEVYDDETDSWTLLPKNCRLPEGKSGMACVVMKMKRPRENERKRKRRHWNGKQ